MVTILEVHKGKRKCFLIHGGASSFVLDNDDLPFEFTTLAKANSYVRTALGYKGDIEIKVVNADARPSYKVKDEGELDFSKVNDMCEAVLRPDATEADCEALDDFIQKIRNTDFNDEQLRDLCLLMDIPFNDKKAVNEFTQLLKSMRT